MIYHIIGFTVGYIITFYKMLSIGSCKNNKKKHHFIKFIYFYF